MRLSDHFVLEEFICPHCASLPENSKFAEIAKELDKLRRACGRPVYITSGYRCSTYNAIVGGAPNSFHMSGEAADIAIKGMTGMEILKYLFISGANFNGIGIGDYYLHVDLGNRKSLWTYSGVLSNRHDKTIYR